MPYATEEARGFRGKLVLLQVTPEPVAFSPGIPGVTPVPVQTDTMLEEAKKELNRAGDYLDELATPLHKRGMQVETLTVLGRAGQIILDYADKNSIDLIAMATHGRGGLHRAVFGSVASFVLRESGLPILLIRPQEGEDKG